jgi:intracellular multiplication protein IcmL
MKKIGLGFMLFLIAFTLHAACPERTDRSVEAWSYEAMMASFGFTFVNYKDELAQAKDYYNESAYQSYQDYFKNAKLLDDAIENKLISTVGLERSPIVIQKGLLNNLYAWKIESPLIITLLSANNHVTQYKRATLLITQDNECTLKITEFSIQDTNQENKYD